MTMEDYLAAPLVADPLSRYDCVPVVAGAQAIVVANPDRCPRGRAGVRVRAHCASFNYDNQEGDGLQTGITTFAGELWRAAAWILEISMLPRSTTITRPWCSRSS